VANYDPCADFANMRFALRHVFQGRPNHYFGFFFAMFLQTFAPLLYPYTQVGYPTEIWNSGVGLAYGFGRLANAGGPMLIVSLYDHCSDNTVFVNIATCWILAAITIAGLWYGTKV
jgi:putative MFS transporter